MKSSAKKFSQLGLSAPILAAVEKQGYTLLSPIQAKAIPAILTGKDVMAAAQTGTGKTAGFVLPMLQKLQSKPHAQAEQVRGLILTPTRELAAQVHESVQAYGAELSLRSAVVFGGVNINPQISRCRKGTDILVATPGRLIDLYNRGAVNFKQLQMLVLDEADRMLDMGFIHDIKKIIAMLPARRQNLLFSATFSTAVRKLARGLIVDPIEITISPEVTSARTVKQWICPVDKKNKANLLFNLIVDNNWQQVLIFSRTKHGANRLANNLCARGIEAAAIHGNKSQSARTKALANFKSGTVRALVATDIAARGIDIDQLPQVVNVDLPNVPEDYVHRIGRTGRAGMQGHAVSLVCADEIEQLQAIEKLLKRKLKRVLVDGFEPVHDVPEGKPVTKAKKPLKSSQRRRKSSPRNTSVKAANKSQSRRRQRSRHATHAS